MKTSYVLKCKSIFNLIDLEYKIWFKLNELF